MEPDRAFSLADVDWNNLPVEGSVMVKDSVIFGMDLEAAAFDGLLHMKTGIEEIRFASSYYTYDLFPTPVDYSAGPYVGPRRVSAKTKAKRRAANKRARHARKGRK